MVNPTAIIRTNRKSLSLTISKKGELIVRAPRKLSMEYIYSFIKQKEKWILNKQKVIQNTNLDNNELFNDNQYLFCGERYTKIEIDKLKDIEISGSNIFVPANIDEDRRNLLLIKWYSNITKEIIMARLSYFADLMQVNYSSVKIDNSKSKWGSCSINAELKFNLRLSMLPHKVIDYIVIHELSHLLEFNHSKEFYRIIESVMPDYKKHRARLKEYNFALQLLR